MSKLNVEELCVRDIPKYTHATAYQVAAKEGYRIAIREVAQPIADERDELIQLLRGCLFLMNTNSPAPKGTTLNEWGDIIPAMRAILAKYPKKS